MYATTYRLLEDHSFQKTMSWRTGARFKPEGQPSYRLEVAPQPPVTTGNLGRDLKRRLDYYSQVNANLQGMNSTAGNSLAVRVTDSGHMFQTTLLTCKPGSYRIFDRKSGVLTREGLIAPQVFMNQRDRDFLAPTIAVAASEGLSLVAPPPSVNSELNNLLTSGNQRVDSSVVNMLPDHGEMGWGETLFEFARGNIPRLLPELFQRVKRGKALDPRGYGRDLGSEYLNLQFGILPVVRDVENYIKYLLRVHDDLYSTYKRQRGTYPSDVSFTGTKASVAFPAESNNHFGYSANVPKIDYFASTSAHVVGKFTKVQPGRAANTYVDQALAHLRRLGFNEKLTWDLIPFSWLVDWSGHIGSSIENAAAFNSMTGRYLSTYMWASRRTSYLASFPAGTYSDSWNRIEWGPATVSYVVKDRTPFDPFGVRFANFSPNAWQLSILGALGLTIQRRR